MGGLLCAAVRRDLNVDAFHICVRHKPISPLVVTKAANYVSTSCQVTFDPIHQLQILSLHFEFRVTLQNVASSSQICWRSVGPIPSTIKFRIFQFCGLKFGATQVCEVEHGLIEISKRKVSVSQIAQTKFRSSQFCIDEKRIFKVDAHEFGVGEISEWKISGLEIRPTDRDMGEASIRDGKAGSVKISKYSRVQSVRRRNIQTVQPLTLTSQKTNRPLFAGPSGRRGRQYLPRQSDSGFFPRNSFLCLNSAFNGALIQVYTEGEKCDWKSDGSCDSNDVKSVEPVGKSMQRTSGVRLQILFIVVAHECPLSVRVPQSRYLNDRLHGVDGQAGCLS